MPTCPVCKKPVQVFKVYTYKKQKFINMNSVCIPCKEKADKELLQKLSPKQS